MMNYLLLFFAVVAGYIIANFLRKKDIGNMSIFMAFSGAFLLSITVFELLPEVFTERTDLIGVYIMSGILLQIILEFFSKGAEHGHVHLNAKTKWFPWLLFISLSIHAFLEGFPIKDGNNLLWGVLIHKIPVAIILSFFFIKSHYSKTITLIFLLLFAIMTPLGNYVMNNFNEASYYSTEITAIVIGIFLHVSTTILFESSKDHKFNLAKLLAIISAIVLAFLL